MPGWKKVAVPASYHRVRCCATLSAAKHDAWSQRACGSSGTLITSCPKKPSSWVCLLHLSKNIMCVSGFHFGSASCCSNWPLLHDVLQWMFFEMLLRLTYRESGPFRLPRTHVITPVHPLWSPEGHFRFKSNPCDHAIHDSTVVINLKATTAPSNIESVRFYLLSNSLFQSRLMETEARRERSWPITAQQF